MIKRAEQILTSGVVQGRFLGSGYKRTLLLALWLLAFLHPAHIEPTSTGLLLPEGLKEVSESFFDDLIIQGKWADLWRDDPYREFNRRLAAAENFTELGLFEEAAEQADKAERALQISWGILRGREGLGRNLPALAEFQQLGRNQRNLWLDKMYHDLRLALQREELSFLSEDLTNYVQYREHCQSLYAQLRSYGYSQEDEKILLERLLNLINTPTTAVIFQLSRTEPNPSETGRRILRRLLHLLMAQGDKSGAIRQIDLAIQKNRQLFNGITLARYLLLTDRPGEAEATLRIISLKQDAGLLEYRIFFHGRMLLLRLLMAEGRLNEAMELLTLLEQERLTTVARFNTAAEIRTYLAEQHYRLHLELAILRADIELKPPEPAFSEISQKLYQYILSWRNPLNPAGLKLLDEAILSAGELNYLREKIAVARQCEMPATADDQAAIFTERMMSLLLLQPINCSFQQWEHKLLHSGIEPARAFYLLERRLLLEEAMTGKMPALSLPVQQALFHFRKTYLLGETTENIPFGIYHFKPECKQENNCLFIYQSPHLLAYTGSGLSLTTSDKILPRDLALFPAMAANHPELLRRLSGSQVSLTLFAHAHMLPWEEAVFSNTRPSPLLLRKLPPDPGACSQCSELKEWRGLTVGLSSFAFGSSNEPSADIITAFRNGEFVPLNENTARRLKEILKKKAILLLHLPGEFSVAADERDIILKNRGMEVISLRTLSETAQIGALVLSGSHIHEVMMVLPHIAAERRTQFLIYSLVPGPDEFRRSFYYDLYSRLDRRGKPFTEALPESRSRAQKSLAESDWIHQLAIYVP